MSRRSQAASKQGTLLGFFKPKVTQPPEIPAPPSPKQQPVYDLTEIDDRDDKLETSITTTSIYSSTSTTRKRRDSFSSNYDDDSSSQSSIRSSQSETVEMESSSSKYNIHGLGYIQRSKPRFSSHSSQEFPGSASIADAPVRKKPRLQPVIRQTVQRPAYGPLSNMLGPSPSSSTQRDNHFNKDTSSSSSSSSSSQEPVSFKPASTLSHRSASQPSFSTPSSAPYQQQPQKQQSLPVPQKIRRPDVQPDYVAPNFLGSSRFGSTSASRKQNQIGYYRPPSSSVAVSSEKPWETSPIPLFNKTPSWQGFGGSKGSMFPKKPKKTTPTPAKNKRVNAKVEYAPQLSNEQQRVLDMVIKQQQSVFFTGSAGTGKSVLMRAMISALKNRFGEGVAVTASTGIAACNISGCTLHSFGGIGMGMESVGALIKTIEGRKVSKERWEKTKVLIIDEISMVDAALFDKLEAIARHFRQNPAPFGGIQLIVTGDFFQLPPVKASGFAFEAKTWPSVMKKTVVLNHVFRQKDQVFIDVLNEMRIGQLSAQALELFKSLDRPLPESKIEPAELYPLRRQVEESNHTRLEALTGPMHEFTAFDSGKDPKKMDSCIAPGLIRLKKNAQVMLLKNMDSTLVNGSLGIVIGFVGEGRFTTLGSLRKRMAPNKREQVTDLDLQDILAKPYPVVRFADDREIVIENDRWSMTLPDGTELANRSQIPLILAWAMSIHKSQGQTLERVKVDLGQSFEDGMAYVALSRATSLHSLQIINFNPSKVTASPKVAKFYQSLQSV